VNTLVELREEEIQVRREYESEVNKLAELEDEAEKSKVKIKLMSVKVSRIQLAAHREETKHMTLQEYGKHMMNTTGPPSKQAVRDFCDAVVDGIENA